ncbi:ParB/Srx family N-terminal domain-containing protein [Nocardia sp. IFM 10818]
MTTTTTKSPAELTAEAEADFEPVPLSAEAAADLRARIEASKTGRALAPINPRHVDVRRNVRNNTAADDAPPVKIDAEYVASIKERLLQVPSAYLLEDNTFRINDGQRRTLAARSAGLAELDYVVELPPKAARTCATPSKSSARSRPTTNA